MIADGQYEDYLKDILDNGVDKNDRTGTGTRSVFGRTLRYDLSQGFPLITTKKVFTKGIILELLWFLQGNTNSQWLEDRGVNIWKDWAVKEDKVVQKIMTNHERALAAAQQLGMTHAQIVRKLNSMAETAGHEWLDSQNVPTVKNITIEEKGELGPIYGKQWRSWRDGSGRNHDQITQAIELIKNNPDSRRILVNAWNVGELEQMALTPCHVMFQFYVAKNRLSCFLYQRSVDSLLGLPFNIASYALLTHMFAHQCDLEPGEFIWSGGDCHIYSNHFDGTVEQLSREPYPFPTLQINRKPESIFEYQLEDFTFVNYQHHPAINFPIAV